MPNYMLAAIIATERGPDWVRSASPAAMSEATDAACKARHLAQDTRGAILGLKAICAFLNMQKE